MFVSIRFIESSTNFLSESTFLISSSVFFREFSRSRDWCRIFYFACWSFSLFWSWAWFYVDKRATSMVVFSVLAYYFRISLRRPFSSVFSKIFASSCSLNESFRLCNASSIRCMSERLRCHLSSKFFLLATILPISSWASLSTFFASSVSSFWLTSCAARMFFCYSSRLISSFIESISTSCFFLIFSRLATFS